MKIVFLDRETLPEHIVLRKLSFHHDLVCHPKTAAGEVEARIADADMVIVNKVKVSAEAISRAAKLRFIAVAATGTNNVDLAACKARGIPVSNIRNYARTTVPEHTIALMLALRRNLFAYREAVARQRWQAAAQFCF